jgi:hypothetical protein
LHAYFFSSFFMSGEDGVAEGEDGLVAPPEGGVDGLEEDEDGEDEGELEPGPFFDASSPQAASVNAAAAAISRDLVIPVP